MNGWLTFLIIILVVALLAGGGWFGYQKFYRNRDANFSLGYPAPAPSTITDKIKEAWNKVRNPKMQTGAGYESTGYRGAPSRRTNALDPDEAWDSRVGNEAEIYGPNSGYYEEQELGLREPTSYQGATGFRQTETLGAPTGDRGRDKSPGGRSNPFGDDNAASLRSISPRPHVDTRAAGAKQGRGSAESSPTTERRSIFRENV